MSDSRDRRVRPPVAIVGMHRCGTSAVAGLVSQLDIDLGPEDNMMPAHSEDNPRGFFERLEICEINDQLFEAFGGTWWDPPEFPPGWEHSSALDALRSRAAAELARFDRGRWAIKDPRLSLTLPFWRLLIGPLHYIVCVRHPAEVEASLNRRYELHPEEPAAKSGRGDWGRLWLAYVNAALAHTAGSPRLIVDYRRLVAHRRREVARLGAHLGVGMEADRAARLSTMIDPALWRQRAGRRGVSAPLVSRWQYGRLALATSRPSVRFGWVSPAPRPTQGW